MPTKKIRTCLWFDRQAEEAARFYVSLFPDAAIEKIVPSPDGTPLLVEFQIRGTSLIALNGGPHFQLNEAVSLSVDCETQSEIDELWERLCEGGAPSQCGWLTDRFGLSWQIVPSILPSLMSDPRRAEKIMAVMMPMKKLDIGKIRAAAESV